MGENSKIEWTDHTFNPWIGCTKISPACDNCYAALWDVRYEGGKHWGAKAPRRKTSEKNWNKPIKWNRHAESQGIRLKIFCASLADVFDNKVPKEWREELWDLIKCTPHLDWLLLTKRPQNIESMLPADWGDGYKNVWLGTTVENQKVASQNIPILLQIPAHIRFLSCEPLLDMIDLTKIETPRVYGTGFINALTGDFHDHYGEIINTAKNNGRGIIDWVIVGGESGSNFRQTYIGWFEKIQRDCEYYGTAFLFKQYGGPTPQKIKAQGRALNGKVWTQYPNKGEK